MGHIDLEISPRLRRRCTGISPLPALALLRFWGSRLEGTLLTRVELPDEVSLVDLPHLVPRDLLYQQELRGHGVRGQDTPADMGVVSVAGTGARTAPSQCNRGPWGPGAQPRPRLLREGTPLQDTDTEVPGPVFQAQLRPEDELSLGPGLPEQSRAGQGRAAAARWREQAGWWGGGPRGLVLPSLQSPVKGEGRVCGSQSRSALRPVGAPVSVFSCEWPCGRILPPEALLWETALQVVGTGPPEAPSEAPAPW